ncbi:MAG: PrsW family intramembrane metalloprotease [Haloarculaceae archaeon]
MARRRRDPIQERADGRTDLYGITDWEVRSNADRAVRWLYGVLLTAGRGIVVLAALAVLVAQFVVGGLGAAVSPVFGAFVALSALPALGLAAYVWHSDVTRREPLSLLVVTFLLGVLFAGFAGVVNTLLGPVVLAAGSALGIAPQIGIVVVFYLVVGPVEETVKLLAVRLYAYRDERFGAVIDGAVYGAVAGLGFATIENALYISRTATQVAAAGGLGNIALIRTLAGPGHVIYSAFAGYYLGLAKFNADNAGPIVLKGVLLAALIHATYNTLAGIVPAFLARAYGINPFPAFILFVLAYDGLFGLVLVRKLARYRRAYWATRAPERHPSELTEFDPERSRQ